LAKTKWFRPKCKVHVDEALGAPLVPQLSA